MKLTSSNSERKEQSRLFTLWAAAQTRSGSWSSRKVSSRCCPCASSSCVSLALAAAATVAAAVDGRDVVERSAGGPTGPSARATCAPWRRWGSSRRPGSPWACMAGCLARARWRRSRWRRRHRLARRRQGETQSRWTVGVFLCCAPEEDPARGAQAISRWAWSWRRAKTSPAPPFSSCHYRRNAHHSPPPLHAPLLPPLTPEQPSPPSRPPHAPTAQPPAPANAAATGAATMKMAVGMAWPAS